MTKYEFEPSFDFTGDIYKYDYEYHYEFTGKNNKKMDMGLENIYFYRNDEKENNIALIDCEAYDVCLIDKDGYCSDEVEYTLDENEKENMRKELEDFLLGDRILQDSEVV